MGVRSGLRRASYPEQIQVTHPISLTGGFSTANWVTPAWTTNQTILDGQNAYRPLTINADGVRVSGFVVRNGNASGGSRVGGGIFIGAVNVVDRAALVDLRLENNLASNSDGGEGGGLAVAMGNTFNIPAELTLSNVTVVNNTASTGSLGSTGGGMSLQAVGNSVLNVDMANVTVQGNTGGNDFSSSGGGMALDLNGGLADAAPDAHPRQPCRQDQDNFGRSQPGGRHLPARRQPAAGKCADRRQRRRAWRGAVG